MTWSAGVWVWLGQAVASGVTIAIGRPWTALLSRSRYPEQVRHHVLFAQANRMITAGWTSYFALAALITGLTVPWAALAFAAPTPILGWLSFRVGDWYAKSKMAALMEKGDQPMASPAQHELREMISDKSDDQILGLLSEIPGGEAVLLDLTIAGMADALDPDNAQDCVLGYEIESGSETYAYRIEVRGTDVTSERKAPTDARVVLQLRIPEYLRLITGLLDGTEAFMSGRMRIRGDVMFAPQVGRMFLTA